jgi:hypothetical protein
VFRRTTICSINKELSGCVWNGVSSDAISFINYNIIKGLFGLSGFGSSGRALPNVLPKEPLLKELVVLEEP